MLGYKVILAMRNQWQLNKKLKFNFSFVTRLRDEWKRNTDTITGINARLPLFQNVRCCCRCTQFRQVFCPQVKRMECEAENTDVSSTKLSISAVGFLCLIWLHGVHSRYNDTNQHVHVLPVEQETAAVTVTMWKAAWKSKRIYQIYNIKGTSEKIWSVIVIALSK